MAPQSLGEFELLVLLAILQLGDNAHAVSIVDEVRERTGREVQRASVYVTLQRLEDKRLVSSWLGEPVAERGGKARRHVKPTRAGVEAVRDARQALQRMWSGLGRLENADLTALVTVAARTARAAMAPRRGDRRPRGDARALPPPARSGRGLGAIVVRRAHRRPGIRWRSLDRRCWVGHLAGPRIGLAPDATYAAALCHLGAGARHRHRPGHGRILAAGRHAVFHTSVPQRQSIRAHHGGQQRRRRRAARTRTVRRHRGARAGARPCRGDDRRRVHAGAAQRRPRNHSGCRHHARVTPSRARRAVDWPPVARRR